MIGRLSGILIEKASDHVIVDVAGVGYAVFTHARLAASYELDAPCILAIETHVREDHIHLFGFESSAEREWFRALLGVERVGARMALNILNALHPTQILTAVLAKDTTAFSQISGVGPKLAERLVIELKDKVLKLPISGDISLALTGSATSAKTGKTSAKNQSKPITPNAASTAPRLIEEATSALVNMGYTRSDALTRVTRAIQESDIDTLDALITASLRKVS